MNASHTRPTSRLGGHPVLQRVAQRLTQAFASVAPSEPALRLASSETSPAADVVLRLGSRARPTVALQFALPFRNPEASVALATTPLAWEGVDLFEAWRALAEPLHGLPRIGKLDERRPWVVSFAAASLEGAREVATACDGQLHIVGGSPLQPAIARGAVWWPALSSVLFAVLGRAHSVVSSGPMDPWAWDAQRADVPVTGNPETSPSLAGLVPLSLLEDDAFFRELASVALAVRRGQAPEPLFTPERLRAGRRLARSAPAETLLEARWRLAQRRYGKLRREPDRFFSDSRYGALRSVGKWWFPKG